MVKYLVGMGSNMYVPAWILWGLVLAAIALEIVIAFVFWFVKEWEKGMRP